MSIHCEPFIVYALNNFTDVLTDIIMCTELFRGAIEV